MQLTTWRCWTSVVAGFCTQSAHDSSCVTPHISIYPIESCIGLLNSLSLDIAHLQTMRSQLHHLFSLFLLSSSLGHVSAQIHGEGSEGTEMGPVAFMWPSDRIWDAAHDNTAPCGSAAGPSNRTIFPLQQGQIALSIADDAWFVAFRLAVGNSTFTLQHDHGGAVLLTRFRSHIPVRIQRPSYSKHDGHRSRPPMLQD